MSNNSNYFLNLVERAMALPGLSHMRPVIEKELLHYDILFALNRSGLLDNLVFQGGTALRLCYGAVRFSEDLDFAGGENFKAADLEPIKACLEQYLTTRYGLEISVTEPTELTNEQRNNIKVSKWQIKIITHPSRKNIPKQMIKLEIANIKAHTKIPRQLIHNYDFLPDHYQAIIIMTETLNEIMSDKIVAFIACQKYIRYRDIWDLQWLKQKKATFDMALLQKKFFDYQITDYNQKKEHILTLLPEIIFSTEFKTQLSRFLPDDVQKNTLLNKNFLEILLSDTIEIFSA